MHSKRATGARVRAAPTPWLGRCHSTCTLLTPSWGPGCRVGRPGERLCPPRGAVPMTHPDRDPGKLTTTELPPAAGSVTDPVCGMTVDPATAAGSATHGGKTYHFCSHHCLAKFTAD